MKTLLALFFAMQSAAAFAQLNNETSLPRVKTMNGVVEGIDVSGIKTFRAIPFAAPPVGALRWKEPQPVNNWQGIRKADKFGPRAMQRALFSDMMFRSDGISEDCLYLNVWTPAKSGKEHLPVLVYFYGGGFSAGDGSEYRYDGESMARKGIVAITVNYRLSVFGFLAHPELTKESPHHASGNYGLMDQSAALKWVQQNIAAFGGDPKKVTIAGESAGSYSVSAQMASPLSKNYIAGAIGESGSLLGKTSTVPLAEAEQTGLQFAKSVGAVSLAQLRAMNAEQLIEATAKPGMSRFPVVVDGYFFPTSPITIYTSGQQALVPLLIGWNSQEDSYRSVMQKENPTVENYKKSLERLYGNRAADALKAYNVSGDEDVEQVATQLASDRFIAFGTWKWFDLHTKTSGKPVYRYLYMRPRPLMRATPGKETPTTPQNNGAVHSSEIEYALGNLPTNRVYDWQPEDYRVSEVMQTYFANFIKTGNPNGLSVPLWPAVTNNSAVQVMYIDVESKAQPDTNKQHYFFLDELPASK